MKEKKDRRIKKAEMGEQLSWHEPAATHRHRHSATDTEFRRAETLTHADSRTWKPRNEQSIWHTSTHRKREGDRDMFREPHLTAEIQGKKAR